MEPVATLPLLSTVAQILNSISLRFSPSNTEEFPSWLLSQADARFFCALHNATGKM